MSWWQISWEQYKTKRNGSRGNSNSVSVGSEVGVFIKTQKVSGMAEWSDCVATKGHPPT